MHVPPPPPGVPYRRRWRPGLGLCDQVEQMFNAYNPTANLTPASQAGAVAVRAAWLPRLPGQTVPLIGERLRDGGSCNDL